MKKLLKRIIALIMLMTICVTSIYTSAYAQTSWDGVSKSRVYEEDGFKVTMSLSSYWNGGYNADIKIENTGDTAKENWYLGFEYDDVITNIWNAEIVTNESGYYVIKNATWNQDIAPKSYVQFGISSNEDFGGFPDEINVLGTSVELSSDDYIIDYKLDNDWGTGFVSTMSITNISEDTIEDWLIEFDYDREITNIWNGTIESHEGNHYVIKNAGYNANISAGQSITFGFNGCDGTATDVPYDCKLVAYKLIDSDGDGIEDSVEDALGMNKYSKDADGDGLTDYYEIFMALDPNSIDTDGNGVSDGNEDTDEDGLANLEEIEFATIPIEYDTDEDGLNDYDEIYVNGTDPLLMDTDKDGALDGWEIANKYDPLTYNDMFKVICTQQGKNIEVSVVTETSGDNISSFTAEEVTNSVFLDESVPGYIGSAFDFSINGTFEKASISFCFSEELLNDPTFDPVIYYFNEETQMLEELETYVDGNVATTTVTHFSKYILLNKTELDKVWDTEIKPPEYESKYNGIDVVFVIDSSGSMDWNDGNNLRLQAAKEFVDKLGENDRAAVVDFDSSAKLYQKFTKDHNMLYNAINRVDKSGGTNLSMGMSLAISQFTSSEYTRTDAYKYIIFLTDGDGTYSTSYTTQAKDKGITVYTIGLSNNVKQSVLENIALGTGGKYYFASKAEELGEIYEEVSVETVDYSADTNGDGISDYYTKLLCEGTLKLGTGKNNPFNGTTYEDVQASNDYDNDGLLNGQELVVKEEGEKVYVHSMSSPVSSDSDYDGIDDCDEIDWNHRYSNEFEADISYTISGTSYDTTAKFVVDYSMFFEDNTKFNQDLAVLGSLYSLDMYNKGWLTITDGTDGCSEEENGVSLGEIFGLNDGKNYSASELKKYAETKDLIYVLDEDDVSEVYIGHRLVSYNGEQKEIFFLTVRGTNGTHAEWSSNFDIGADTDAYYDKTGEHPEWINKDNHKGFDVTANRIMKAFDEYVAELEEAGKIDKSVDRSIFITGHSRGAAIANILGANFEYGTNYDSYVYTMASPYTTTSPYALVYETIFNIVNEDDLVTYLPIHEWGFERYGETLTISVAGAYEDSNPFENAENTFERMFDKEYNDNAFTRDDAVKAFEKLTDDRESYYELDITSGDGVVEEGILDSYYDFVWMLEDGKLDKYCKVREIDGFFVDTIEVTYSPAYVAQIVANLATSSKITNYKDEKYGTTDWIGIDLKGKYSNARTKFAIASGKIPIAGDAGLGGMECPHMPGTYYLITSNTYYWNYER